MSNNKQKREVICSSIESPNASVQEDLTPCNQDRRTSEQLDGLRSTFLKLVRVLEAQTKFHVKVSEHTSNMIHISTICTNYFKMGAS